LKKAAETKGIEKKGAEIKIKHERCASVGDEESDEFPAESTGERKNPIDKFDDDIAALGSGIQKHS
jgi:hypothetical protein